MGSTHLPTTIDGSSTGYRDGYANLRRHVGTRGDVDNQQLQADAQASGSQCHRGKSVGANVRLEYAMWDYDSLIGKARVYFERAESVADADDDAFAVWLLLGLEFLLRAPLAQVSPMLLADPNGEALLHAAGFPGGADAKEPKSIQITTVVARLRRIIEAFTAASEEDATFLTAMRNRELHTGEAILASIDVELWLPRFTRVADVICTHLGLDATEVVGKEVMVQGRALVDAENKKLAHEITTRIATAKAFAGQLNETEIHDRWAGALESRQLADVVVDCPACGLDVPLDLEPVRTTNERFEDGEILRDIILVARALHCPVCSLDLASTAEVRAAGLRQQHTRTETETIEDRFLAYYEPDDYGND